MKNKIFSILIITLISCMLIFTLIACDKNTQDHTCVYDQLVANSKFEKNKATCTEKATFYLSCTCGKYGIETFEVGNLEEHNYKIKYNESEHWKECACGVKKDFSVHSGGAATCENLANCSTCNQNYGTLSNHVYENKKCKWCQKEQISEGLTYRLNSEQEYELVGIGTCKDRNLIIPSEYCNIAITSISSEAFQNNDNITSVFIPSSIKKIGSNAFNSCSSLKNVIFEKNSNITTIGENAFAYCNNLNIKSYNNVKYLPSEDNFYFVAIGVQTKTATNYELSPNTQVIADYTFYNTKITTLEIPKSVKNIGKYAFSFSFIETISFETNSKLKIIDSYAFYRSKIKTIEIPSSVTHIEDMSFSYCEELTSVMFYENSKIQSIGNGAFYLCNKLQFNTYNNAKYLASNQNKYFALIELVNTSNSSYEINKQTRIISNGVFALCSSLKKIILDESNSSYKVIDGNLYTKDESVLVNYAIGKTDISFHIPNNIKIIAPFAFYHSTSLEEIFIPKNVVSIGNSAFANSLLLKKVNFEDNSNLTHIGECAFLSCSALEEIKFGKNSKLTEIAAQSFTHCTSLTQIALPNTLTIIGASSFNYCTSLVSIKYFATMEKWLAISKGSNWDYETGAYIITYNYNEK